MSLRSLTTCSYVSDATSFAMRHCTIVVTPLPMFPEPDSFRPREIHHRPNASCLGNEKKSPCRWWLIDGCKSLFNVKPSTVPTRLIPELDAHTRTTHPERFLRAEKSRRPNTQHQMGRPSILHFSERFFADFSILLMFAHARPRAEARQSGWYAVLLIRSHSSTRPARAQRRRRSGG
jgi:hypothetical protein